MSVVEVIVALVLLGVGLLGVAGTTVVMTRGAAESARAAHAAQRLLTIGDSLSALPCALIAAGFAPRDMHGVAQRWTPTGVATEAVIVDVEVAWMRTGLERRTEHVELVIPCE